MTTSLSCRWVPNTLDLVQVQTAHHSGEVSIDLVARCLGRRALEGLYLSGRYALATSEEHLLTLLLRLLPHASAASLAA